MPGNWRMMPFCSLRFTTRRDGGALHFDIHWTKSVHQKVQKLIALVPAKSIKPPSPKKLKAEALVIVEDEVEDEQTSTSGTNPQWLKFQGCLLTEKDREAIVSNYLLNDRHINYAQTLLH